MGTPGAARIQEGFPEDGGLIISRRGKAGGLVSPLLWGFRGRDRSQSSGPAGSREPASPQARLPGPWGPWTGLLEAHLRFPLPKGQWGHPPAPQIIFGAWKCPVAKAAPHGATQDPNQPVPRPRLSPGTPAPLRHILGPLCAHSGLARTGQGAPLAAPPRPSSAVPGTQEVLCRQMRPPGWHWLSQQMAKVGLWLLQ